MRSVRKPRHWWVDNEVIDVFGDELGPFGIMVYAVMARHAYDGYRVTMDLREIAGYARMSKDSVARTLRKMVGLGLLVEHKGRTLRSVNTYDLTDVKELVKEMRASGAGRDLAYKSVSHRDSDDEDPAAGPQDEPDGLPLTNHHDTSGDAPGGAQGAAEHTEEVPALESTAEPDTICLPQRQIPTSGTEAAENPENDPAAETDLSQNEPVSETDLSLSRGPFYRQYTKPNTQDQVLPHLPPRGGGAEQSPFPEKPEPGSQSEHTGALKDFVPEQAQWATFLAELKRGMHDPPIGVEGAKRWKQVRPGEHDFAACFSGWWLLETWQGEQGAEFVTFADDEATTEAGIAKYGKRLTRLARKVFSLPKDMPVSFTVRRPEERAAAAEPAPGPDEDSAETPPEGYGVNGEIPAGDRAAWAEVQRLAKEHLERLAKSNAGIKAEWAEQAIEPARLAAVKADNGRRVWTLLSPAPEITRAVIELVWRPVVRRVAGDVEIRVVGGDQASGGPRAEGESP